MKTVNIPLYRAAAANATGIGWFAVQKWEGHEYVHICTERSRELALERCRQFDEQEEQK